MAYPSTLSTIATPNPNNKLSSPSHSSVHGNTNVAITEIQTFVGTLSSAVGTLVYDIRSSQSDGGGHVQKAAKGGTGQTDFIKGDLLVAQNSSTLTKLAVGTIQGHGLIVDSTQPLGVKWGIPGGNPTPRIYTTGGVGSVGGALTSFIGIWNKPSNLAYITIEAVGGGGGGGGANSGGGDSAGAGGGGGGGYTFGVIPASSLPTAASIIVGKGGGGGNVAGSDGSVAGTTYFGSIIAVLGGNGGTGATNTRAAGGLGGVASIVGDYVVRGYPGSYGMGGGGVTYLAFGGNGGSTPLGSGAPGGTGAGANGSVMGGGGAGAAGANGTDNIGGLGADGGIIIYEY